MPVRQVPSKLTQYTAQIVRGLIDQESALEIHEREGEVFDPTLGKQVIGVVLDVRVDPRDVGKVLGGRGRLAEAIRQILYAFAGKHRLPRLYLQVGEIGGSGAQWDAVTSKHW